MSEEEITTEDTQPEEGVDEAVSEDTDDTVEQKTEESSEEVGSTLTLEELNKTLGKDFKDKESALKSLQDTNQYVGKKKEDVAKDVSNDFAPLQEKVRQLEEDNFYAKNPGYAPYKDVIEKMGDRAEVVKTKQFKEVFDKLKAYDEQESSKSVIHSNSRLSNAGGDYNKDMEAAQKSGKWAEFLAKHKGIGIPTEE